MRKYTFATLGLILAVILTACGAAPVDTTEATPETSTSASAAPTKKPEAKPKPAAPKLSKAAENAKSSAQSYLDLAGFSKKGLVKQLKFEGYKAKDIDAALATMKIDWNAEAAESAQAYQDLMPQSRKALIKQLQFEGFTTKQAEHGADSVGL